MMNHDRTAPESAANAIEGLAATRTVRESRMMVDGHSSPPDSAASLALIRSITSHATDPDRALDEVRAVLAGGGIDDILTLRGDN